MPTTFWVYDPSKPTEFKALSVIMLFLVCICDGLLFELIRSGALTGGHFVRLFLITLGAYTIILAVDVSTQTFGYPISKPPILIFMVVGVVLFTASGIIGVVMVVWRFGRKNYVLLRVICLLVLAILCILIALMMVFYILGVFFYKRQKSTKENQEYHFCAMRENLNKGDVILRLVNPNQSLWSEKSKSKLIEMNPSKTKSKSGRSTPEQGDKYNGDKSGRSTPEQRVKYNGDKYNVQTMQVMKQEEKVPLEHLYTKSEQKILIHPKTDDYILTQAGKLMDRPTEDMVGENVRTSELELTDSTEITSLKGKFYLVKGKTPEALNTKSKPTSGSKSKEDVGRSASITSSLYD